MRQIENLIWNLKNYLYWIPKLWNNWNFDADFHLILSIHKLKQMHKFFNSNDSCVLDRRLTAYYIRRAIYFAEKSLECDYYDEERQRYLNEYYDILKRHHNSWWD